MNTTCILCPSGCGLEVKEENGILTVSGNACKRGENYGKEEFTDPRRIVTALIKTKSGKTRSVKSAKPISKNRIFDLLDLIKSSIIDDSLKIGDIAVKNALGLVDILLTN